MKQAFLLAALTAFAGCSMPGARDDAPEPVAKILDVVSMDLSPEYSLGTVRLEIVPFGHPAYLAMNLTTDLQGPFDVIEPWTFDHGSFLFLNESIATDTIGEFSIVRGPARFSHEATLDVSGTSAVFFGAGVVPGAVEWSLDCGSLSRRWGYSSSDPMVAAGGTVAATLPAGTWNLGVQANWIRGSWYAGLDEKVLISPVGAFNSMK